MLFSDNETNLRPQTVTELSGGIQTLLETHYRFVKVRGEVSNFVRHSSGHYYFSVKDENASISVILWKDKTKLIGFKPQDGMEVVVSGKVSSYAKSSRYSITASNVEICGEGQILKIIQERKLRLEKLGFFNKDEYLPVVKYPKTIGIITSKTGAVIVDIVETIKQRFSCKVVVYNALMQGSASPASVIGGLKYFAKLKKSHKIDCLIIARGGGSIEDLFYFNDEDLIKQTHKFCKTTAPVISAIGHGTDFTLLDLASTIHAVTPTAAAQMAVPSGQDIIQYSTDKAMFCKQIALKNLQKASTRLATIKYSKNLLHKVERQIIASFDKCNIAKYQRLFEIKTLSKDILKINPASDIKNIIQTQHKKLLAVDIQALYKNFIQKVYLQLFKSQHLINLTELAMNHASFNINLCLANGKTKQIVNLAEVKSGDKICIQKHDKTIYAIIE